MVAMRMQGMTLPLRVQRPLALFGSLSVMAVSFPTLKTMFSAWRGVKAYCWPDSGVAENQADRAESRTERCRRRYQSAPGLVIAGSEPGKQV
jgi:hypothetical protein